MTCPPATTIRPTELHRREERLRAALAALLADDRPTARRRLERLLDDARRSPDLTAEIFAAALARRLDDRPAGANLYLRSFDRSQLSLFDLLATHLPLVAIARRIANGVLADALAGADDVALVAPGIGLGEQEADLLDELARRGRVPRRLRVLAVDPDPDGLARARRTLAARARRHRVALDLLAVEGTIEGLDEDRWRRFADAATAAERVVVGAAFALHHIVGADAGEAAAARDRVLARLRALAPAAIVLCEPSADHLTDDLARRFEQCLAHYSALFGLIDRVDASDADRAGIKRFFAREIEDVLAGRDDARAERHEPAAAWVARLVHAGFVPTTVVAPALDDVDRGITLASRPGHVAIDVDGVPLLAVVCAETGPRNDETA